VGSKLVSNIDRGIYLPSFARKIFFLSVAEINGVAQPLSKFGITIRITQYVRAAQVAVQDTSSQSMTSDGQT